VRIGGQTVKIQDLLSFAVDYDVKEFDLLVDRAVVHYDEGTRARIADSVSAAFYEGKGCMRVDNVSDERGESRDFSDRYEADGVSFIEPSIHLFSYNSPLGACPRCEGFGKVLGVDESLVVPNTSLSVYQNAVAPWRGEKMGRWRDAVVNTADVSRFPIHKPYYLLTGEEKDMLWHGCEHFAGIDDFFAMLDRESYKMHYRIMAAKYRGKTTCPECGGLRLRHEASYVKVAGRSITELVEMPLGELKEFFDTIELTEYEEKLSERLLYEIRSRLDFALHQKRRPLFDILFANPGKPCSPYDDIVPFRLLRNVLTVFCLESSFSCGQRKLRHLATILKRGNFRILADVTF
jgi:excinuclease ABC subunit A